MPAKHEIEQLQDELHAEVNADAPQIAAGIFGDTARMPDMAQVSNQQLDDLYRSKYQSNDRTWLQAEARRDPVQFLNVAKRIGVQPPSTAPGMPPPEKQGAIGTGAPPTAAQQVSLGLPPALPAPAALPVAPPVPVAGPSPVPLAPAAAPVILGPNGMPLPPSGMA